MTHKAHLVDDLFPQVNCAQTVFSLYAEEIGLDEKTALKIASGFGGGMTCAETCGAATGAYMVIGMKHGHATSDAEAKAVTKQKIQLFNEKFKEAHGSLICKELVGYDISIPEIAAEAKEAGVFESKCPLLIKSACNIIDDNF